MKSKFMVNRLKVASMAGLMAGVMAMTSACVQRNNAAGKLRELSYDPSAQNIALLFGAPNGLPGIPEDLESMKAVLEDPQGGNGFKVVLINEATSEQILDATRKAAVDAGENGTIFWYFSGHGAESGTLMTVGGMLPFSKVTDVVRDARQTPVKRFYAMFDSCFSGQMVDG
ncbi:MAG: Caspase domain, partial [Pseudomonadota bacterium]